MRRLGQSRSYIGVATLTLALAVTLGGCSEADTTGTLPILSTDPYTTLRLNVRGAVMSTVAPYDTLQLIPTAYTAMGKVIALPGPVTYAVSDTTVGVNASGLVTIKSKTGTNSYVIASVQDTAENVTHADTVYILGTTTVPSSPLAHFSIQPLTGDSAILDINAKAKTLAVTASDAAGHPILSSALEVHFSVSNVDVASVVAKTGALTSVYPGTVSVYATTTYYGVTKTDTVRYTIGYPDITVVTNLLSQKANGSFQSYFQRNNLVIGVKKTLIFEIPYIVANAFSWDPTYFLGAGSLANAGLSVVFDDSSAAIPSPTIADTLKGRYAANGSGNITLTIPSSMFAKDSVDTTGIHYYPLLTTYCKASPYPCAAARAFSSPGTYTFRSALTGASGTITVVQP